MTFSVAATSTTSGTAKAAGGIVTAKAAGASAAAGSKLGAAAGMGKQDFLQLLIAQLKNQDPMKPMEDREFVTQLAQFSSLETLEALKTGMEELAGAQLLGEAAGLIGKQVEAKLPDGSIVKGVVSQVKLIDGKPRLQVGDKLIELSLVTNVGGTPAAGSGAAVEGAVLGPPPTATTTAGPATMGGASATQAPTSQPRTTTTAISQSTADAAAAARAAASATAASLRTSAP